MKEAIHNLMVRGIKTNITPKLVKEFNLYKQDAMIAIDVYAIVAVVPTENNTQIYLSGIGSPFLVIDSYDKVIEIMNNCHIESMNDLIEY